MNNYKIVSDSAADILSLDKLPLSIVPLHILVGEQEFVDDANIDLNQMQAALTSYKGKSSTACPSPQDWVDAFEDYEAVFCVTITSGLSGSCSSANTAKALYEGEHPDRKVYVIDSLSTGPEMVLILDKLQELILSGLDHTAINDAITDYQKSTHLYFSLASVNNLARNGRINPIIAKGVSLLGIRILGIASSEGKLEIKDKGRGDKSAFKSILSHLRNAGYKGGRIVLAHHGNESGAQELKELLIKELGAPADMDVHPTRGLCSYYAEPGSFLVGFEA